MEQEGYVSLWVGRVPSTEALEQLLTISYNDDGESIPSAFGEGYGLDWYDDDFREAEWFTQASSQVIPIIQGCSYEKLVLPRFVALLGEQLDQKYNAVILLYNFKYDGNAIDVSIDDSQLKFLGTVEYV